MVVSAGASGAVFGVYGGLLAFLVMQRGVVPTAISMGIAKSAGIFLVYNLIYGLSSTNVDLAAHGGGLVFGFLAGCALAQPLAVDGQRVYPIRTLTVALCGVALAFAAITHLPRPSSGQANWYQQIAAGNRVKVGHDDYVFYSGTATKADAESLGKVLTDKGFFNKPNGLVLLAKGSDGTVVSIPTGSEDHSKPTSGVTPVPRMVPDPWNDSDYLSGVQTTGVMMAPSVGGPPIKIALLSSEGEVMKVVPITARSVTIGTQDNVWYMGNTTAEEAMALGQVLQKEGFFRDKGARVALSKGEHGTELSFMVRQGTWDDPRTVQIFQQIGRKVAPVIGGVPLTVHLVDRSMTNQKDIDLK
jgi:hypothetical protein